MEAPVGQTTAMAKCVLPRVYTESGVRIDLVRQISEVDSQVSEAG
jgi:hypothetical protein